jgi:hypothetical protein
MRRLIIEQTEADLTSRSGLALVGMATNRHTDLVQTVTWYRARGCAEELYWVAMSR